jgi:hypothetical protein
MSRACTVCLHERREEIDKALVKGTTYRTLAARYGPSITSFYRHKRHLRAVLREAQAKNQARDLAFSVNLAEELKVLKADVMCVQERARRRGAWGIFLRAVDRRIHILETQAKLEGRLGDQRTQVNIVNLDPATVSASPRPIWSVTLWRRMKTKKATQKPDPTEAARWTDSPGARVSPSVHAGPGMPSAQSLPVVRRNGGLPCVSS